MEVINLLIIEALIIVFWCWWLNKATSHEKFFWGSLLLLFFAPISLYVLFCQSYCLSVLESVRDIIPAIMTAGVILVTATIARITGLITRHKQKTVVPGALFWWTLLYCLIFIPLYLWFTEFVTF